MHIVQNNGFDDKAFMLISTKCQWRYDHSEQRGLPLVSFQIPVKGYKWVFYAQCTPECRWKPA